MEILLCKGQIVDQVKYDLRFERSLSLTFRLANESMVFNGIFQPTSDQLLRQSKLSDIPLEAPNSDAPTDPPLHPEQSTSYGDK